MRGDQVLITDRQFILDFDEESELEKKFWEFHFKHPDVYSTLVSFARQWRQRKGMKAKVGIKALYERARWEIWFESLTDEKPPKLSNNHTAFYARLLMKKNPELEGIFRLKAQKVKATFEDEGSLSGCEIGEE
tara:strand:- start:45 stop:443 length:399 start_codon:yes stop_codon:yes gene_type:complete